MKPPPGPMFSFGPDPRVPAGPADPAGSRRERPRHPAPSRPTAPRSDRPAGRPTGDRRTRTAVCAVGLAVALALAGAALLAPYGSAAESTTTGPTIIPPTTTDPSTTRATSLAL